MYEYYTINHVALITGLTSRTIRNYIKLGLLEGEMINGVWHFSIDQVGAFINHPSVSPSIKARRNALIYDFLSDERKPGGEMCSVFDAPASLKEANAISEFFCHAINTDFPGTVHFAFSFNGSHVRVILKGSENAVLDLLNRYHQKN